MMNLKKLFALCVALMMLFSFAMAEEQGTTDETAPVTEETTQAPEEAKPDLVLANFNGVDILQSECEALIQYYAEQFPVTYAQAAESLVNTELFDQKVKDLQFDVFTEEELAEIDTLAQAEWDNAIKSYVDYFLTEDTEEARTEATKQAEEYYASNGLSMDYIKDNMKLTKSYERLQNYFLGDAEITDEEVDAVYQTMVEEHKAQVQNDATIYEMYSQYYGPMYYIPAGYRNVLHILLSATEEQKTALGEAEQTYAQLHADFENQSAPKTEEGTDAENTPSDTMAPVTEAQVEEAKLAVEKIKAEIVESNKATIDEIEQKLANGESFKDLIPAYSQDPGQNVNTGYNVHASSIMWDPAFVAGTFSDKMQKVGDHSDPVVGSYGVHIIYYNQDVPEGALPITEAVKAEIKNSLLSEKLYQAQSKAVEDWIKDFTVTYNTEAINELDGVVLANPAIEAPATTEEPAKDAETTTEE